MVHSSLGSTHSLSHIYSRIQRVISSSGYISPRGDNGLSVQRQRDALMMEGVEVVTVSGGGVRVEVRGGGKERVDLKRFGWFPDVGTVGDW